MEELILPKDQGVFETILFDKGELQLKELHFDRLLRGIKGLDLNVSNDISVSYLEQQIMDTIQANEVSDICRVRLRVYQGKDTADLASFLIECFSLDRKLTVLNDQGLILGIADDIIKPESNYKRSYTKFYSQAANAISNNNWDDVLVLNQHGNIIESSIANVFWIKNNIIYTPPLSEGCVEGVMRRYIIETLQRENITIQSIPLTREILLQADEVFITNSIRRIKWVANTIGVDFGHTLTDQLYYHLFPQS